MTRLAEFAAYYDASGSESDGRGALMVIGLVATKSKWLRFEREWDGVLKKFGVPYFHMKEFAPSNGPFAKWLGDDETRRDFIVALVRVMKHGINKAFGTAILVEDFKAVDLDYPLTEVFGGAFGYVAGPLVRQIDVWLEKKHPGSRSIHIFEKGDTGQAEFIQVANEYGFDPIPRPKVDPATSEWFAPFQTADLMSWEYRRALNDGIYKDLAPIRRSFHMLERQLPTWTGGGDRDKLLQMCQNNPIRYPKRGGGS